LIETYLSGTHHKMGLCNSYFRSEYAMHQLLGVTLPSTIRHVPEPDSAEMKAVQVAQLFPFLG
jgi:hypothetical protein